MHPDTTALLANYPNPFNPETWIPYQLAHDTNVTLTIYDIKGAVVRRLDLGYQMTDTIRVGQKRRIGMDATTWVNPWGVGFIFISCKRRIFLRFGRWLFSSNLYHAFTLSQSSFTTNASNLLDLSCINPTLRTCRPAGALAYLCISYAINMSPRWGYVRRRENQKTG